ncbi:DNA-directed RNA polymerase III subunit RPC3-like [Dendronephthya gigantea]|uniref:DNA-directed RNA polymerase III subunit RPC3-like n=1 Tax=Dendronephthya gigantea TaxID=151771 RepID=UPI00106D9F89|nr:DNA-directed RNA polymerase III subunit RPC3-like [Dendronephthya gigantea]
MSATQLRLASWILKDHYGEIVANVCLQILRSGWATLASIIKETALPMSKIKRAVCVLIQHNMVKFQKGARGQIMYSAQISNILAIVHFPKLVYCAKTAFGNAAELIIKELLLHGKMTMSSVVTNVTNQLLDPALNQAEEIDQHNVADQFVKLVEEHLIKRHLGDDKGTIDSKEEQDANLGINKPENVQYDLPVGYFKSGSGKRKAGPSDGGPAPKKRKNSSEQVSVNFEDSGMLWQVNIIQFYHCFVNEMVENAVKNRLDESAAEIVKVMLNLTILSRDYFSPETKPVSVNDIDQRLNGSLNLGRSKITQYLNLLQDDEVGFVSKVGENAGGVYVVNIKKSVEAVCLQSIESVIRERCGSKSLRIFNLLRIKRHLEQKQVEDLIMVPSKEAKERLYNLLSEKFINLQEVPRATDYAPSRTFYLFSVNVSQVCRMLLDRSYKTVGNLMCRRNHETEEQKRLVEKSEKINSTILALKTQGMDDDSPAVQEVKEMMTNQETQQLAKLQTVVSKLEQGELQVADTILTFTQFLALSS